MNLDVNRVITGVVTDLSKSIIGKTYEAGSNRYKKLLAIFKICFTEYLKRGFEKYSKIKTLLYRDKPVDLKSHYVPIDFRLGNEFEKNEQLNGQTIFQQFKKYKRNIIVGTAGVNYHFILTFFVCFVLTISYPSIPF